MKKAAAERTGDAALCSPRPKASVRRLLARPPHWGAVPPRCLDLGGVNAAPRSSLAAPGPAKVGACPSICNKTAPFSISPRTPLTKREAITTPSHQGLVDEDDEHGGQDVGGPGGAVGDELRALRHRGRGEARLGGSHSWKERSLFRSGHRWPGRVALCVCPVRWGLRACAGEGKGRARTKKETRAGCFFPGLSDGLSRSRPPLATPLSLTRRLTSCARQTHNHSAPPTLPPCPSPSGRPGWRRRCVVGGRRGKRAGEDEEKRAGLPAPPSASSLCLSRDAAQRHLRAPPRLTAPGPGRATSSASLMRGQNRQHLPLP